MKRHSPAPSLGHSDVVFHPGSGHSIRDGERCLIGRNGRSHTDIFFAANVGFGENRAALSIAKTSPLQAVPHHIADVKVVIQKARLFNDGQSASMPRSAAI
jgi:hypothetical protein